MYMQIPNALSVSRIVLAVLVILASTHLGIRTYVATVCMFVLAMVTDALDGYLARRWGITGERGYVMDAMGDRAFHLALILVFLVRYSFHPLFVWLLIFRDIGIYAVRVLSKEWLHKSRQLRWISLFHAMSLRIWLGLFILRDGFRVFKGSDILNTFVFEAAQMMILCTTLVVSYYGLFRSFSWLVDSDHKIV
jgi:phosphatidylglycerophosphate synthase